MDADRKAKWIAALRSGKYEQGNGFLKDIHNRFCCLGVLADIHNGCEWRRGEPYVYGRNMACEDEYYLLPEFAELTFGIQKVLAAMNDKDRPFTEIADWIERNVAVASQMRPKT